AYASGPGGATFGPGSAPVPGIAVNLDDASGQRLDSATTAPDGSYHFSLPSPGSYIVSTEQQDQAQVNVPGRHALQFDTSQPNLSLKLTTTGEPNGPPLYQVGYTSKDASSPVTVSADFFNDGRWDTATLGWSPSDGGLYLVIIRGGDSPGAISATSVLLVKNFQISGALPGLSWSGASGMVVVYFTDHALGY